MELMTHWRQQIHDTSVQFQTVEVPHTFYILAETSLNFELALIAELESAIPLFAEQDMVEDTPHLYQVDSNTKLLKALLEAGIGQYALCFIWSSHDVEDILHHLRHFCQVVDPQGSKYWLRFWDPRVFPYFQQGMNPWQTHHFYTGIAAIGCEDYRNPEVLRLFHKPEEQTKLQEINEEDTGWNKQGTPVLSTHLETCLMQGFQTYHHYQLAQQLFNHHPKSEMLDFTDLEAWVKTQSDQLIDWKVDDTDIHDNLITAAWLQNQDMTQIRQHAKETNAQVIGLYSFSLSLLQKAKAAYHSEYKELNS